MTIKYVTITGADDKTSHEAMIEISKKYPFVEWGILLSSSVNLIPSQGTPRYPSLEWVKELKRKVEEARMNEEVKMNFSAHLCGGYTREMIEKGTNDLVQENLKDIGRLFGRVQLNFNAGGVDVHEGLYDFITKNSDEIKFILQNNKANAVVIDQTFKRNIRVDLLWDSSGGRGVVSDDWALPFFERFTGYAGGLNPDNLAEKLEKFFQLQSPVEIWIDAETGVRTNDELDLVKVEKFLEIASKYTAPYPKRYDFSKEDRYVIAEFVFSDQADVLIVSDCTKLVEVLAKHGIIVGKDEWMEHIDNKAQGIVSSLRKILTERVAMDQGKEIMNEYYGK